LWNNDSTAQLGPTGQHTYHLANSKIGAKRTGSRPLKMAMLGLFTRRTWPIFRWLPSLPQLRWQPLAQGAVHSELSGQLVTCKILGVGICGDKGNRTASEIWKVERMKIMLKIMASF